MKIPAWALKPKTLLGIAAGVLGFKFGFPKIAAYRRRRRVESALEQTMAEMPEDMAHEDVGGAFASDTGTGDEDVAGASTLEEIEESAVSTSDDDFETAFELTLHHEAHPRSLKSWPDDPSVDYINVPGDRGGPTNWGIIQATYDSWRDAQGLSRQSVRDISADEVRTIYRDNYWLKSGAAAVEWPLNAALYDFAVNSGPRNAIRELQKILGVPADGGWGPVTAEAANTGDPDFLAMQLIDAREQFFRNIVARDASQQKFLAGWLRRLEQLRTELA